MRLALRQPNNYTYKASRKNSSEIDGLLVCKCISENGQSVGRMMVLRGADRTYS